MTKIDLLTQSVENLANPDWHALNDAGLRTLHALLLAFAKHELNSDNIGWDQLGDIMHNVLCNEFPNGELEAWADNERGNEQH